LLLKKHIYKRVKTDNESYQHNNFIEKIMNSYPSTTLKNCLLCKKELKGRTDKKFCNDYCRNAYNNQLKSTSNNVVRTVNNCLGKNHRILESIFPKKEKMIKVRKEKLIELGYYFKYTTQVHKNRTGSLYYYCYEFGYLPIENEWFVIFKKEL